MTHNASLERAIQFIKNFGERGISVKLKADGSVPATLTPPAGGWDDDNEQLSLYLRDEVRLGNFQDVMRRKGYASIFLTTEHAESVLHIRVMPGPVTFHYVD